MTLKDNIIIFDEAHNIPSKLKEASSITISLGEDLHELDENSNLPYDNPTIR